MTPAAHISKLPRPQAIRLRRIHQPMSALVQKASGPWKLEYLVDRNYPENPPHYRRSRQTLNTYDAAEAQRLRNAIYLRLIAAGTPDPGQHGQHLTHNLEKNLDTESQNK